MRRTEYDTIPIENTHIASIVPIESPFQLKERIVNQNRSLVAKTRQEIRDILHGEDTWRLVVATGPCSLHDRPASLEYAQGVSHLRNKYEDNLVIVMRSYVEKPRTTLGWTGMINDPHLDGSFDIINGLAVSRQLLADINNLGVPCAVEFVSLDTPQYYGDLVSWAAIGARTTEGPVYRHLASGLSMPVGFKNTTEGNIQVAVDAIITAKSPHIITGINEHAQEAKIDTTGNPDTHIVLRGGGGTTNYDAASINKTINLIQQVDLLSETSRPIMVDCSHGNSEKKFKLQSVAAENVLKQIRSGQRRIMGLMFESHLHEGNQQWVAGQPLKYGVSITDSCIGWEETERLVETAARAVQSKIFVLNPSTRGSTYENQALIPG